MRYLLRLTFTFFVIACASQAFGQNLLSKANKQYELKAFNYAIANYVQVLRKEPTEPQALARLADSYRMVNNMDESARWFAKAVNYAGIEPVHFLNYGKVLMALGKYDDAKIWFGTYAESNPTMGNQYVRSCDYAISLRGKPATFRVYKEYLNTTSSDFGPAFYGDYIVYSSSRTDIERSRKKNTTKGFSESPSNQLYITSMDNKGFLRIPTLLQSDLVNNYNEGPVAFSNSGEWVVFTKNIFEDGIRQVPEAGGTLAMYIAEVDSKGTWRNVKPLPFNRSGYSAGYPAFSPDGKLLYFSSNREGGFGGWDIYVAFRTATGWSVPQNLGPVVNSPGDEISPNLDGNVLYFSSDYHPGMGGMDVFRAEKRDGQWNDVYHLGNAINSSYDDYGYIFKSAENRGYVVSNRSGSQGNEDVYKVRKMTDNFVISVVNESDMRPVEGASVDFTACGEPVFKTDINGRYAFQALAGLGCEVIVKKEGYKSYALKINSLGERLTRSFDVKLRKISDEYSGMIVDSGNNSAIPEVYIKATNRKTGLTLNTISNQRGEYKLALESPEEYTIRYSKAGYIDTHKRVSITTKTDKSLLGVLSFKKSYSSGTVGGGVVMSTDDYDETDGGYSTAGGSESMATNGGGNSSTSGSGSSMERMSESMKNGDETVIPELDNVQGEAEILQSYDASNAPKGYAVQVAAYFDDREVKVGQYQNLQEIGNVYKMKDGKAEKVRVGIFTTKAEAEDARKSITKKGYQKAFIVAEEGRQNAALRVEDEKPMPTKIPVVPVKATAPAKNYKVRVATFRSTKNFDDSQLEGLGKVERRKAGKFTIVLLTEFESEQAARNTQKKVADMGYKDAHLVVDEGKRLKKVQ